MRPVSAKIRGAFCRTRPARGPFRAPARSCLARWPADRAAARVHRGVETTTRPLFATLFARAFKAACAPTTSASGLSPRARPRTTRNTPDHWRVVGAAVTGGLKVAFRPGQPPKLHRDRGREHRTSALPNGIAPAGDFAPTPSAPGTSCRENHSLPCPERRGKRVEPPAPTTLARHGGRQGRAACHLREEGRRSPTRGAFCPQTTHEGQVHRSARSRSWTATAQRLFHHQET